MVMEKMKGDFFFLTITLDLLRSQKDTVYYIGDVLTLGRRVIQELSLQQTTFFPLATRDMVTLCFLRAELHWL